uniref:Serine aminopeptidase S33 domain-containing protein n=1 Tax=Arcella intermedia TaxID=1963864 RepID=A0A6B2LB54_9EUKA
MGISMGGAVAMLLSLRRHNTPLWANFKGTVLLAPAILQTLSTPPYPALLLLKLIMWFGGAWLRWGPKAKQTGWREMIEGLPEEQWPLRCAHTHVEALNSPYAAYPRRMILNTGIEMLSLVERMERSLEKVTVPFFVVHGEGDGVIPVRSSRLLIERASSTEKSIKIYPKLVHSIVDDPLWEEEVEKDVWNWIIIRTE